MRHADAFLATTGATLGYLRPLDPAHPLPERRYALDEAALPGDDGAGAG